MQLKFTQTIIEGQEADSPVAAITWAPNNRKLAVATHERVIVLFDESGMKRDKFNTKPADPNAGKRSYCIVALAFSGDSEMLGVAQSDSIVFVYRIGAEWGGKKVICNKFSLKAAATMLIWNFGFFISGQLDGKIRILDCRTNKASTVWAGASACIALTKMDDTSSEDGNAVNVISGHYDGTIFVGGSSLIKHPVPPTVLCILDNNIVAGGCDGRVIIYDANTGRLLRNIDRPKLPQSDQKDLIVASSSPGGQVATIGAWDGCVVLEARAGGTSGISCTAPLVIDNLGSARAVAWSNDGARLAVGSPSGAVLLFEAILRRWIWRGTVEVRHVAPKRILLTRLARDVSALSVETKLGTDIYSVKIMGNDWYAVCRTNVSLILCDMARGLVSEIKWPTGGGEKFSMQVAQACLIYKAGELFVVEYGQNYILATVRTERVNPHVLSVRLNEGKTNSSSDNKKLAYLLDKQTVAIVDLITGVQILQIWHDARINWLELSETAHLLLLRDSKKKLILIDTSNGKKDVILSGVGFVQWVEDSDAVVAQTPTHIAVWYCMDDPGSVELAEAGGGLAVGVEVLSTGSARVLLQSGSLTHVDLDQARLKFNGSLREDDLEGCVSYLGTLGDSPQVVSLWQKLADRAMSLGDLALAVKCYKALGDEARAYFLEKTIKIAAEDELNDGLNKPMQIPAVRARLAMLARDLPLAAEEWSSAGRASDAIQAFRLARRWAEAAALAERFLPERAKELRDAHFAYLNATERYGEAGALLAARGDTDGALSLWVSKGKARRAARLLLSGPGKPSSERAAPVLRALVASRCFEPAGELAEALGDSEAAVRYYSQGECYSRAVQLAREAVPEAVADLERRWGDWLRSSRAGAAGAGAAVAHYIEAGDTRAALAAAVDAKHYKKALQIIRVIDDPDSVRDYYDKISDHFISTQEWETAEKLLVAAGLIERCVNAYNAAEKYAEGLNVALRYMEEETVHQMYMKIAENLKAQGQLRQAEAIYCGLGEFDEAIAMYKEAENDEAMVRLVGAHRPDLLSATRRHLAAKSQTSGQLRQAENHYLQAGDWKNVIQMYRNASQWEDADRVAQQYAPAQVQQQVVMLWAAALGGSSGARLVSRRGLLAAGARWACAARHWELALALAEQGAPMATAEVHGHMARALQADGRSDDAEAAFLRGGCAAEALEMRMRAGDFPRALALAERHAPDEVNEVLQAYAAWAAEQNDLSLYEALMIRANKPHDVINYYKENDMWVDALRVCGEYVPGALRGLRAEAARAGHNTGNVSLAPQDVPELLQTASQYANSGSYWEAVSALLSASSAAAAGGGNGLAIAERAAIRAAKLARDHLSGSDRVRAASAVYERMAAIGQEGVGEQLKNALLSNQMDDDDEDYVEGERDGSGSTSDVRRTDSAGGDSDLAALARSGNWIRCLQLARLRGSDCAARWAAAHAAFLLQQSPANPKMAIESLSVYGSSGAGSLAGDLLATVSALLEPSFDLLRDLRDVLHSMATQGVIPRFGQRMMEAAHLRTVTAACSSTALKPLAVRAAVALLRYTDIITADLAFYSAGEMLKNMGRPGEAFVFLNRYLDLAEAVEEGNDSSSLDYSDFESTDFPRVALLPPGPSLSPELHEEVREWVLTASMDNTVDQTLPLDSRDLFESSLSPNEEGCILTGYPVGAKRVNFTNGRSANRDAWSKLQVAASSEPSSPAADVYRFVLVWCGQSDYSIA